MKSESPERSCSNCRRPLPETPLPTADGVLACSPICVMGLENGRQMKEIVELGRKWMAFFREVEATSSPSSYRD